MTLADVPQILNYGAIGLAFLFAFLAYRLLHKVTSLRVVGKNLHSLIVVFMVINMVSAVGGFALEFARSSRENSGGSWGSMAGNHAQAAFLSGGSNIALEGLWEVRLFERDENGKVEPYRYRTEKGDYQDYGPERIVCRTNGSVVSFRSQYSTGEHEDFWGEGRLSAGGFITSIYWSPVEGPERDIVGVNFLEVKQVFPAPPSMEGWWYGRSRDQKVHQGPLKWTKI